MIAFRRIHGRIVPVKVEKKDYKLDSSTKTMARISGAAIGASMFGNAPLLITGAVTSLLVRKGIEKKIQNTKPSFNKEINLRRQYGNEQLKGMGLAVAGVTAAVAAPYAKHGALVLLNKHKGKLRSGAQAIGGGINKLRSVFGMAQRSSSFASGAKSFKAAYTVLK